MSAFECCLPSDSQPIEYKHHHSWSVKIIPCLQWIPDFWKVKIQLEKRKIIVLKKAQYIERISHSTILTNDQKYSTVTDMKIYAMVTAILGCVLCAKHWMLYIYHPISFSQKSHQWILSLFCWREQWNWER